MLWRYSLWEELGYWVEGEVTWVLQGFHYWKPQPLDSKNNLVLIMFFLWCHWACKRTLDGKDARAAGGLVFYPFDPFVSLSMMTAWWERLYLKVILNLKIVLFLLNSLCIYNCLSWDCKWQKRSHFLIFSKVMNILKDTH